MAGIAVLFAAAVAEIAGCFAFWAVLRLDASRLWLLPGAYGGDVSGFVTPAVAAALNEARLNGAVSE